MNTTPTTGLPGGMTKYQVATACLCCRSSVTPAYVQPNSAFAGQPRIWHTPQQCGQFESVAAAPALGILRGHTESDASWQARIVEAYPVIR